MELKIPFLDIIFKRYNEEDDKLERYVQDLLLEEKQKDLNLHPIIKAKKSLYLGRFDKVNLNSFNFEEKIKQN